MGNSVVAIGWPARRPGGFGRGDAVGPGVGRALPDRSTILPPRGLPGGPRSGGRSSGHDSYLVDSASSHMLVSKIKPCMSKYKQSIP